MVSFHLHLSAVTDLLKTIPQVNILNFYNFFAPFKIVITKRHYLFSRAESKLLIIKQIAWVNTIPAHKLN